MRVPPRCSVKTKTRVPSSWRRTWVRVRVRARVRARARARVRVRVRLRLRLRLRVRDRVRVRVQVGAWRCAGGACLPTAAAERRPV